MGGKRIPGDKKELVKAVIYLHPELSERDVAKETNTSKSSVHDIKSCMLADDTFNQYRAVKKREQIIKALDIASAYIDHLADPDVINKSQARDSAIVAGTMIDKAQLLAGEPTTITERKEPTLELLKEYEDKLARLKQLTGTDH